ncbi:MAG: sigma-54 dependent transcriptional regulator [Ignavibacteriales bacterium]|nr:sigma-54 dependent transcriptional regulator [Ignavibacteriales bacterium]
MNILVVDDEASQRSILSGYLKKKRHVVYEADSVARAIERFAASSVDAILTDFQMPHGTGVDLLKAAKNVHSQAAVIIMTAFGTIEGAVTAMREGAFDYLTKPINLDELDVLLRRIEELHQLKSENQLLREQLAERHSFAGIISQSAAMEGILSSAARVAQSSAAVLIRGESGVGKELIAKAVHFASDRKDKPFVAVNCAALNENLLESELFGHEKGAFTGADRQRRGRFEMANGGTLFLDEIGDIPPATQVRLLRVLQEHQFERVGGSDTIQVDVRVIAATNKDLEDAIGHGTFREDLFYRLNVIAIEIPPLRKRRQDIAPLLELYLIRFGKENKRKRLSFTKEAWDMLLRYDYPGNVRELENIVQRAVIMSRGEHVSTDDLPQVVRSLKTESMIPETNSPLSFADQVEKLEKDLIFDALRTNGGNQSKAAKKLGLSERNLRYRLGKWGVK